MLFIYKIIPKSQLLNNIIKEISIINSNCHIVRTKIIGCPIHNVDCQCKNINDVLEVSIAIWTYVLKKKF